TQRVTEDMGVTAVILGARDREAVAETIELLGIDGKDRKPVLEQHLHHRTVRHLDRDGDLPRCRRRLLQQPISQFRQSGSAMAELPLTNLSCFGVKQDSAMALRCPIDPDKPMYIFDHCWTSLALKAGPL